MAAGLHTEQLFILTSEVAVVIIIVGRILKPGFLIL